MPAPNHLDHFDLDIGLRDASCDENLLPVRRAIAALCIGVGVDDAYLSVRELREAVSLVHENAPGGRAKLAGILSTQCDDFQRAIYYCLAGRGVVAHRGQQRRRCHLARRHQLVNRQQRNGVAGTVGAGACMVRAVCIGDHGVAGAQVDADGVARAPHGCITPALRCCRPARRCAR